MKKLVFSISTVALMTGSVFAGQPMASNYKETPPPAPVECVSDREWQVDLFGSYAFTGSSNERILGDHAWGGGLGVNYFFTRNVGLGIEGQILDPASDERDNIGTAGINLFFRFPMECFVPYIFGGGDVVFNASDRGDNVRGSGDDALWAGHAGIGIEYRVSHNVGIFTDARYTWVEESHNDYGTVRAGVRFAF